MAVAVTRMLLPTRFSVLSRRAAEYVKLMAPALGAQVHVVHVVPHTELIVDPALPPGVMPASGPAPDDLLSQARVHLSGFVKEVLPELAQRTTTNAVVGGVADELVAYAHTHHIDLIVMGTHADSMLKRLVFGSVGKTVLERAPCPVLLVPVRDAP